MTAEISAAETERHSRRFRLAGQLSGAHAPRVLVSAASSKRSFDWESSRWRVRPSPSLSAPPFSRILHEDVDLTFVDACRDSCGDLAAGRITRRTKGPRGDQVAWPERGSPLGSVVFELPG